MPGSVPTELRYAGAALGVLLATAIRHALDPYLGDSTPFLLYCAAIASNAWFGGLGPSLLALGLSGLSVAYFFMPPRGSLAIAGADHRIGLALFGLIGTAASLLTWSVREALRRSRASDAEARRSLAAERDQRVRLRTTLASIADAVIAADAGGRVTGLNRSAERLTGWADREAAGRPLGEVFRLIDRATHRTDEMPVAEVVGNGTVLRSGDSVMLVSRDGRSRPVEHSTAPILEDDGRITGMVLVFRDITERCAAEQALREADRRKDEFLALLAHELRNPLAPIAAALHLMEQRGVPTIEEERAMAQRQVRHMARLIDDLMDVSRIARGQIALRKEVMDLSALVARAAEAVRPLLAERRHDLTISLPEGPVLLEADPTRLEQVVTNLLHNAAKYTDPGGRIRLSAGREDGRAVVRVRDTGIGIESGRLAEVFGLFVQIERRTDRSRGGLGIGLGLVKSLVELHGGSVAAHSEGPGRGSEFVVRLPALDRAPGRTGRSIGATPAPASAGLPRGRILVVDDNVEAADVLGRLLSRAWGQEVRVAYDGPAALEEARAFRPGVVLLDIGLPGMDGCEVARRLRREPGTAGALLVAVTGWGQGSDREKSRAAGFDHHLVKPVEPEVLRGLLATASRVGSRSSSPSGVDAGARHRGASPGHPARLPTPAAHQKA